MATDTRTHVEAARSEEGSGAALIYVAAVCAFVAYAVACWLQPYLLLPAFGLAGLWAVRTFA